MIKIEIYIVFFFFFFFNGEVFAQDKSDSLNVIKDSPVAMTVEAFKSKTHIKNGLLLVVLKADWCVICKREEPIITEIRKENEGRFEFLIIDTKANPLISNYFEVDGLPVFILYKDGGIVWDHMGFQSKAEILLQIKAAEYDHK